LARRRGDCSTAIELVVVHWWENLLHNEGAQLLKVMLLLGDNQRIVAANVPWYL
jgi:hypothetical protein